MQFTMCIDQCERVSKTCVSCGRGEERRAWEGEWVGDGGCEVMSRWITIV